MTTWATSRFPYPLSPLADAHLSLSPNRRAIDNRIARVRDGDRESLPLLFRRYSGKVRRIGRRILRSDWAVFGPAKGAARSWIFQAANTQAFLRRGRLRAPWLLYFGMLANARKVDFRFPDGRIVDLDPAGRNSASEDGWRKKQVRFGGSQARRLLTGLSMPSSSSLKGIPNPCESVRRVRSDGTRLPRSSRLIAVRCRPHRSANASCEKPLSARNSRRRLPSAKRTCCIRAVWGL